MEIKTLESYNNINKIDFGEVITVFKFGGNWCTPCKNIEEIINSIPGCILYNISVDNENFESFLIDEMVYTIPDCIIKYKKDFVRIKGEKTREELIKIFEALKASSDR